MKKQRAFTLVELLVVIGIIAVLVGVLLPALSSARRSAATVKCAAQLREVGNAFKFYEGENRGYFPVAQYGGSYSLYGIQFPVTTGSPAKTYNAYWINFLSKYVTKSKVGGVSANDRDSALARNSILWGCTAYDGYANGDPGGINRVQTGFGMNAYPTFRANNYVDGFPPINEQAYGGSYPAGGGGNFQKANSWKPATDTCLVADSRFWLVESNSPPAASSYPPAVVSQSDFNGTVTYSGNNQTMVDIYRHGKMPKQIGANLLDPYGGKIAFNVLYADGHVSTAVDAKEAYRSIRKKFPG